MKFLFLVTDFDAGGITSSLRNLATVLCDKEHEVHILNLAKIKELPSDFDKRIKILPLDKRAELWNLSFADIKRAGLLGKIKYLALGLAKKLMNRSLSWMNYAFKNMSFDGYDAVIGFRQSPVCFYLASRKTKGGKKCGFWHVDVDYAGDISGWDYFLSELDGLACVSNAVKEGMLRHYPTLEGKIFTVYNIFESEKIKELAIVDDPYDSDVFNIVTVSRLSFYDKQINLIPEICAKLKACGLNIKWHIVGDGKDRARLEAIIRDSDVQDMVVIHGAKENPFPYVKHADLFVLTSLTESYGMAVVESLILGTPVIAGEYPALPEIIDDGENGLIAENSVDGISAQIVRVLCDNEIYKKIKSGAMKYKYSPDIAYKQFMEMVK